MSAVVQLGATLEGIRAPHCTASLYCAVAPSCGSGKKGHHEKRSSRAMAWHLAGCCPIPQWQGLPR